MRTVIGILLLTCLAQGCSVYKVMRQADPVAVNTIKPGCTRAEVISMLGSPKSSQDVNGGRVEIYEFVDGYSKLSKSRAILYLAADIIFVGLPEAVFWPIEESIGGTEGRAVITYGPDNLVRAIKITRRDGSSWDSPDKVEGDDARQLVEGPTNLLDGSLTL